MKTKLFQKDSLQKEKDKQKEKEPDYVANSNEYIDTYFKRYKNFNAQRKPIMRSISMKNDKSQKKVGTAINWMPREVAKEIELYSNHIYYLSRSINNTSFRS